MSEDTKPVPEPGEANRDDDEIHYYDVDETNVSDADKEQKPRTDDKPPPKGAE